MGERCGHFAHNGDAVSMSHFFALMLQLKIGLFLRADVQSHSDYFQKISFRILQTASAHNHPTNFSVGQKEAVFTFERPVKSTRTIVLRFDSRSLVGMDTRKN